MARKTVIVFECDRARCKQDGDQYTVTFPGGQAKEFILCDRHAGTFTELKDADYGTWKRRGRGFKKTPIEQLTTPQK